MPVDSGATHAGDRFPKLLLKLTTLRALDAEIIEDLFFTNLIGQVQIETVIPYILKLGGAGVSKKCDSFSFQFELFLLFFLLPGKNRKLKNMPRDALY